MPLICYVHCRGDSVPYLEVLPDLSAAASLRRAQQLMAERPNAIRAELWDGDALVQVLEPETAA